MTKWVLCIGFIPAIRVIPPSPASRPLGDLSGRKEVRNSRFPSDLWRWLLRELGGLPRIGSAPSCIGVLEWDGVLLNYSQCGGGELDEVVIKAVLDEFIHVRARICLVGHLKPAPQSYADILEHLFAKFLRLVGEDVELDTRNR